MDAKKNILENLIGYEENGNLYIQGISNPINENTWLKNNGFQDKRHFRYWYESNQISEQEIGCGKESCGKCLGVARFLLKEEEKSDPSNDPIEREDYDRYMPLNTIKLKSDPRFSLMVEDATRLLSEKKQWAHYVLRYKYNISYHATRFVVNQAWENIR